jgi:hypothetical protein
LYSICFPEEGAEVDFTTEQFKAHLLEQGVEMEEFEKDNS